MRKPIKNKQAVKAMQDFERWMVKKVKSIHAANNTAMQEACYKVYKANLD